MTFTEAMTELFAAIQTARDEARESRLIAPNSYGAGYDAGYRDALIRAHEQFSEITTSEASGPHD